MKKFLIIIMIGLGFAAKAQISVSPIPIGSSVNPITVKDKKGNLRAQKVKGKINGSGIFQFKNGDYYIGDFKDKSFHGMAMYIAGSGNEISNCAGARAFVGHYKEGVKSGKGTCYDESGNVIYSGKFIDDKPAEVYPRPEESVRFFADLQAPEFYYIGEFEEAAPHGFGALFFPGGDFLISRFEDGNRKGTSVYFMDNGNWFSEKVDGEEVIPISSSEEYAAIESNIRAARNAALSQAFSLLGEALMQGAQLAGQIQNLNSPSVGVSSYSYSNDSAASSGSTSGNKASSVGDKYNMSDQRSYNSDKSTYNKYDSMLAQVFAGNRNASASEIRNWQSKMKDLRTKWESQGKSFPHSSNEDK